MKSVPLRAEFYAQLRQRDDWKERLMEILKNRVREDIDEKIRSNRVGIDDKLELMAVGKNRIVWKGNSLSFPSRWDL